MVALVLMAAGGCGDVHFIPSPFTPQEVELVYSPQEHLTVVRWRVDASAPVAQTRFELLGSDGSYGPIDFTQSAFTGGVKDCTFGGGSCAQYIVRGHYEVPPGARPVIAVHDLYGVLPGGAATTTTLDQDHDLSIDSFFHPGNASVTLNITDPIGRAEPYLFPRSFEQAMWVAYGLCVSDTPPDDASFSPLDDKTGTFGSPQPLSADGTYCVGTRPIPGDGGDSTLFQIRVATLPEVTTATKTYVPTVERSPVISQLILDLEIPVADRCAETIQKLEALTQKYMMGGGVPVHKLPTINLSGPESPCAQTNTRTVASTDMSQAFKQLITTLPGPHQQYHMMYFNNLDAPIPSALQTSIRALQSGLSAAPDGYQVKTFSWLFSPLVAAASSSDVGWWAYWPWQTPDKNFELKLADYSLRSLPYTSQEHDDNKPVPLLSPDEVTASDGDFIKVCVASAPIRRWAELPFPHEIIDSSWKITSDDPPSYLVSLDTQTVVEAGKYVEASVTVKYQICSRYCQNHPFLATTDDGEDSWMESTLCARSDF